MRETLRRGSTTMRRLGAAGPRAQHHLPVRDAHELLHHLPSHNMQVVKRDQIFASWLRSVGFCSAAALPIIQINSCFHGCGRLTVFQLLH